MFSYLWNLDEAHSCLTPETVVFQKSDAKSERLRIEGNKYYKKKLLEKALRFYNESILYAAHPVLLFGRGKSEEKADSQVTSASGSAVYFEAGNSEIVYQPLALGFANRSAVLFELNEYDKCVQDIEIAISCGYPKILHCKLLERKAKCFIAQRRKAEALQFIETALETLLSLPLDETKRKSSQEALQQLYKQCQTQSLEDSSNTPTCKSDFPSSCVRGLLQKYKTPRPPLLPDPSAIIPSLSSTVQLAFSPTQGRFLVAEKDILPGEVLIVEEGYSRVLHLDSHLKTHCSGCLARCLVPLPCPCCPMVIFCSKECQERALALYHGQECNTLAALAALDINKNSVLAFRILMQTTYSQLKEVVPILQEEVLNIPAEKLGFNSNGIYDSSEYRTIFHLVTNKESRSGSDLFKRCAMAFVLLKILEKSHKFFVNADGTVFTPAQEDILLSGITLFTHMMNLPCNAHSITEMMVVENNYQQSSFQGIGCGVFGVLSLTNHSCNPAASLVSYGSVMVLKAIRHIPAGTEITDSYGEHYAMNPAKSRQAALLRQYYFTCKCIIAPETCLGLQQQGSVSTC
ncbi:hypothetical protein Pcinc_010928 [Petrolisthes cinctipes]|uniref:Protein-lysine N-methyltransferase SMYD4 n=1 Tax=Petrolisthes cinctipes TaxID=88211 RepID=A0AAE1G4J9_PETCI|nr:hypothetical protein Pcinc_010928 [Petrolisthes cinctipes]